MKIESLALYVTLLKKDFVNFCMKRIKEYDISFSQLFIIICVGKKEGISPKEVSNILKIDQGQLNRSLNKLIDNEILIQKKNKNDARANILSLSDKGKDIFEESHNLFYEWDKEILKDIDKETYNELMLFLNKLTLKIYDKKENKESE